MTPYQLSEDSKERELSSLNENGNSPDQVQEELDTCCSLLKGQDSHEEVEGRDQKVSLKDTSKLCVITLISKLSRNNLTASK